MNLYRTGAGGSTIGLVVVLILIVVGAGAYIALNSGGGKTTTTSVSTTTSTLVSTVTQQTTSPQAFALTGAGATFPYPLLSAWIVQYHNLYPNIQVNYQAIGSGGGISALEGHTVDFAASDAPLAGADLTKAANALTIPESIGAVTVAYNLPHIKSGLLLTGDVLAAIFNGTITMWNDPKIASLQTNATLASNLPAKQILVVHRSDGSGTTFVFTGFLSLDSKSWNKTIGQGKTVAWPVGLGANGNAGVAGVVQGTQYTVGYVELAYVLQNKMTVSAIRNPAGNFVIPTLDTSAAAGQNVSNLPAGSGVWAKVNLLNQPGSNTYPIVSFTYLLIYKELNVNGGQTSGTSLAGANALVQFLWWVVHSGQATSSSLSYVPLPQNVVTIDEQSIQSITINGQATTSH